MFYIIFESTTPSNDELEALSAKYYQQLQELLKTQPGFIKETPYSSASSPGSGVLIASFEDEASAHAWRKQHTHLRIQKDARKNIFSAYRVRAGPLLTKELAAAGTRDHLPEHGRTVTIIEEPNDVAPLTHLDVLRSGGSLSPHVKEMASYRNDDVAIHIVSWAAENMALEFTTSEHVRPCTSVFCVRVARDYDNVNRAQAPR